MIRTLATPVNARVGPATHRHVLSKQPHRKTQGRVRPGFLCAPRHSPNAHHNVTLMAKGRERNAAAIAMAHFAGKLHVDKQTIDRVESAVLLSLIGGGLTLSVLGAAVYDIGRAFSIW